MKEAAELFERFSGHPARWVERWTVPAALNAPSVLVKIGGLCRIEASHEKPAEAVGVGFDSRAWTLATGEDGRGLYCLGPFDSREILPAFSIARGGRLRLDAIGYKARRDGKTTHYLHRFDNPPSLVIDKKGKCLRIEGGDFIFAENGIEG